MATLETTIWRVLTERGGLTMAELKVGLPFAAESIRQAVRRLHHDGCVMARVEAQETRWHATALPPRDGRGGWQRRL